MTAATYATSTNSTWKHGDRPLLFVRPFGDAAHYDETERHFRCRRLFVFIHNDSVAVELCSIFGGYWGIATPMIESSSDCSAGSWGWDRRLGIWFILFCEREKFERKRGISWMIKFVHPCCIKNNQNNQKPACLLRPLSGIGKTCTYYH